MLGKQRCGGRAGSAFGLTCERVARLPAQRRRRLIESRDEGGGRGAPSTPTVFPIGGRTAEPGVGQATMWGPRWLGLWFDVWKGGQAPGAKAAPPNRVEGGSVHLRCPFFFSTPRRASDAIVGAMQAQRSWLGFGGGALADLEAQPCRLCPTWCRTGRWRSRRPGHRVPKVVVGGMGAAAWTATVTGVRARVVRRRSHLHDIWLSRRPWRLSA